MSSSLGKWEQSKLLSQHPLTANKIPETCIEVNTTPGIGTFAGIANNTIWRRIVEIAKCRMKAMCNKIIPQYPYS
ncbi:hypothetical protein [Lederbergia citri]|uniref:Uncharacterized protein n=1 Tax=Lederbergia citri TaxID=2833580 RepID=A0A942YGN8_9BACI|nr:hypothetical protein [Lederbergia citri]MBS4194899.1 hypothetical protein [Lederbergia citri]